jgi:GGDEF domain-containing protein
MTTQAWLGIGAQRSGTTWFTDLVTQHPQVGLGLNGKKEQHLLHKVGDGVEPASAYLDLFPDDGIRRGDWTPQYLRHASAPATAARLLGPEVPVLVLLINLWAWRRGDRFGGWLLLSALPFAISSALAIARYLQWVPLSFATEQGVLASMALQMPAMLAVLILRSQHRRENLRRIQGLDRVDPSTGLINEPEFVGRMARMIARSGRLKHQGAVLMIDLVNTDQIQRDFGRKAAEDLPLRVAERLLSTAREIDSAARLSEQRFGMLVEGPCSAEEAATLGPRIVARCLMPYKGLPVACVAQVRVAYALVPRQGPTAEIVLARLTQKLAGTPPGSKRAVFMLPDYAPPV